MTLKVNQVSKYRLDIHCQIKGYYSLFFSGEHELRPVHTSLYMFLLNQNNRSMWVEWFKCPYDLAMMGSGIGSKKTYYKVLHDLQDFKLIKYKPGINHHKAPKIKIINLSSGVKTEQLSVPLSEPVSEPLPEQLSRKLSEHIIRLITSNLTLVTNNLEKWIEKEKKPTPKPKPKTKKTSHLFINSEYFDFEKFASKVSEDEKYNCFDVKYYYEAIKLWSEDGNKKTNWISTAKNWMLRDSKEKKAKLTQDAERQFTRKGFESGFAQIDAMSD